MPRPLTLTIAALALSSAFAFTAAASQAAAPSGQAAARQPADSGRGASPAVDGGTAVQAGNNIGNIVKAWGSSLLLGIAGLMGLAALARRNVAEGLTLLGIVVIVGGFIFADGAVRTMVESLWGAMSGSR